MIIFQGSSEMNGVTSSGGSLFLWTCVGRQASRFIIRHVCSCPPEVVMHITHFRLLVQTALCIFDKSKLGG